MNGVNARPAPLRVLPLSAVGGRERRACAVFAGAGGGVLALQATCVAGDQPTVTAFSAVWPGGEAGWGPAVPLAIDQPLPAVPSLTVPPVLLEGAPEAFSVAWALEDGGHLSLTAEGASVVEGPGGSPITALCAHDHDLYAAVRQGEGGDEKGDGVGPFVRSGPGGWQLVPAGALPCPPGEAVTALAAFQGHLHAATSDARAGFSLWRAPLGAEGPWQAVMTRGAWRHGYNRSVSAMAAVGPWLYVAADGPDTSHLGLGDEHPEVLAVDAQGEWRLFSGQGRFTPDGLRMPVTAAGPGSPQGTGLTIGGLQAQGEDVLAWLRPRGAGGGPLGDGSPSVRRWSAASGAWTAPEAVPLSGVAVTSLAVAGDGTILAAAGADLAALPPEAAPRPLLVALAP